MGTGRRRTDWSDRSVQGVRTRKLASEVIGVGRDQATLDQACRLGAIDRGTTDMADGVAAAQVVVVCTPVSRVAEDVRRVAELAPGHTLVTDAGSTKRQIIEAVERHRAPRQSSSVLTRSPARKKRGRRTRELTCSTGAFA